MTSRIAHPSAAAFAGVFDDFLPVLQPTAGHEGIRLEHCIEQMNRTLDHLRSDVHLEEWFQRCAVVSFSQDFTDGPRLSTLSSTQLRSIRSGTAALWPSSVSEYSTCRGTDG